MLRRAVLERLEKKEKKRRKKGKKKNYAMHLSNMEREKGGERFFFASQ
jgi:hypothetical protein